MSLERIEITPFAVIAGEILQQRRTGSLTIVLARLRKTLYWSQGELTLIASADPEDSLAEFLIRRGVVSPDQAAPLATKDPTFAVSTFHESGLFDMSKRQTLLREWLTFQFVPLFSLEEGTAAFSDEEALPPEKRVFLQSTAGAVLDGIRAITNGLVLRRSLGDMKRLIAPDPEEGAKIDMIPFTDTERRFADALSGPQTIETFLKQFTTDSLTAARVVISMMTLGVFVIVDEAPEQATRSLDDADTQRDLELLMALGPDDERSLRAVAFSRQLASMDHYQLLSVPRAATRAHIIAAAEERKRRYDPSTYPQIVRPMVSAISRRIDESTAVLEHPARRQAYDKLLADGPGASSLGDSVQRRTAQRSIARQNFSRAQELSAAGDYYGAILLLKQAVAYAPDFAEAWHLLGACQERNPKWRRESAESFQRSLSLDPNSVTTLISLGDLYRGEGLTARAQACYEDALKIDPENAEAEGRLKGLKKG